MPFASINCNYTSSEVLERYTEHHQYTNHILTLYSSLQVYTVNSINANLVRNRAIRLCSIQFKVNWNRITEQELQEMHIIIYTEVQTLCLHHLRIKGLDFVYRLTIMWGSVQLWFSSEKSVLPHLLLYIPAFLSFCFVIPGPAAYKFPCRKLYET